LDRSISIVRCRIAVALALALMVPSFAAAQATAPELRVAVGVLPPFAMEQNGTLVGFSVDLWNAVAARLKIKTNYQTMRDATSLIEAMRSKSADVIATPVVITAARDEEFDFSLPVMQTGLLILVRDTGEAATTNPLEDLLGLLFSKTMLLWLGIALVLILVPAHFVWFLERRRADGMIANPKYIPGIFEAMYWAASGLTSQAQDMPHQWLARIFSVFWMFAGVVFVAFYTAQLTTTLTVRQIQGGISGPEDLPGKQVGTIGSSVASDYLNGLKAQVQEFRRPDQMFQALLDKKVEAVVFTAPALLYYAAHDGKGLVKTVGREFNVAPVAFTFQLDSPWRRKVNTALLKLREDGTYQRLYEKWFGIEQ
jgi:polar amino acid transport system substrate-binding protein